MNQNYIIFQVFETFVRSSSYMPFSPLTHDGVWRQLTVRTTRNKDIMVVVVVSRDFFVILCGLRKS